MNDHPSHASLAPPDPGGELQHRFGDRWQIEQPALGVWSATRRSRDGRHIRCIVARTAADLAAKIATADTEEP